MSRAAEQFFPQDKILALDEVHPPEISTSEKPPPSPKPGVKRAATGLSDILDDDNGRKAGGFVLVIDGAALTHVRYLTFHPFCLQYISPRYTVPIYSVLTCIDIHPFSIDSCIDFWLVLTLIQ
jgi:hypothetical protein